MDDDTGMDPENALTAVEPKETRCGSLAVAAGTVSPAARGSEERIDHERILQNHRSAGRNP